jgi:hypothetical protein
MSTITLVAAVPVYHITRNPQSAALLRESLLNHELILAGSTTNNERVRLSLANERVEAMFAAILFQSGVQEFAHEFLSPQYQYVLERMVIDSPGCIGNGRVGLTYVLPEQLNDHISMFTALVNKLKLQSDPDIIKRMKVLRHAAQRQIAVVELQNTFTGQLHTQESKNLWNLLKTKLFKTNAEPPVPVPHEVDRSDDYTQRYTDDDEGITDNEGLSIYTIFEQKLDGLIAQARQKYSVSLNISDLRNDVIAEVLWRRMQSVTSESSINIPVIYADGSQARSIRFYNVRRRPDPDMRGVRSVRTLNIGLMSARHPELDAVVDMYWFRNQEISVSRNMAQTDEICYQKSLELFTELLKDGPARIALYQTGFPPAVMGFYRALSHVLIHHNNYQPRIEVIPMYFLRSGGYKPGTPWF